MLDKKKPANKWWALGDSAAIRTQDLLLRRQLLYPAELRNLIITSIVRRFGEELPTLARYNGF